MKFFVPFLLSISLLSCQKRLTSPLASSEFINDAKVFFNDSVINKGFAVNNRAQQSRIVQWTMAQSVPFLNGQAALVPVTYNSAFMIKANFTGDHFYHLDYLTELLIYKDSNAAFHANVVTSFPDSNFFKNPLSSFSGIKFIEDWQGNTIIKLLYGGNGSANAYVATKKEIAGIYPSETCYTISGYNYSSDDPDASYAWSEDAGCEANYSSIADNAGSLGGSYGSNSLGSITAPVNLTILLPKANSVIQSISNYFQCFTNVGGADHLYTISVCVDQPVPGTRTAWTFSTDGVESSSFGGNPIDVGHTFLILTEKYGNTTISRNVGFYPGSNVKPSSPQAQGVLNDDDDHMYNISGTYTVNNGQFFNVLNYISQGNTPGFLYNLNTNNCTTFAINAVAQGGLYLPKTFGAWMGGSGDDPGDLGQDISAGNIAGLVVNRTPGTSSSHMNVGQCN
jgi:hypothetical protein